MMEAAVLRPVELPGLRLRFVVDNLPATDIAPSPIHGLGLFARRALAAGEVLGVLDGQRVDWASFEAALQRGVWDDPAGADPFVEWNALSTEVLLARPLRTKYGFINHSRAPNAELAHDPLRVVALRAIAAGEELTLDYRREPLRQGYLDKATYL